MTTVEDNPNKLEAKFHTVSDLMAKKRKLYLLKRVKSEKTDEGDNSGAAVVNLSELRQQYACCNQTEENITLTKKSKSNSLSKCSVQSCFFTSANTTLDNKKNYGKQYNYEDNPALSICNGNNRLSESNDSTRPSRLSDNCSCNKNCQSNCRGLPYYQHHQNHHHNNVLKDKSAQKSSANYHNNNNNINKEIYMQNSYYILRDPCELNPANTDQITVKTSCASAKNMPSASRMASTMSSISVRPSVELVPKFRTSKTYRTCPSISSDSSSNHNFPTAKCNRQFATNKKRSKRKFLWQFVNLFMLLKTLLVVFFARTTPSLLPVCPSSTDYSNKSQIDKRKQNYGCHFYHQNSCTRANERLTSVKYQGYCLGNKQKSSLINASPSVSFAKMILLGLSFLSIFLPFTQASSFETTLQSSLAAVLERSQRDVNATSDLSTNASLSREQVRLAHPEHVCKSLDIRNTAEQFRQLKNCTVIEGFLLISLLNENSLEDYNETYPMLTEITDFLIIHQVYYLRSLAQIFPNLSIIRGRILFEGYALIVYSNSHLEELGLSQLTTISRGGIRIENNVMLCYVDSVDWSQIVTNTTDIVIEANRDSIECPACPGDQWNIGDSVAQNELSCKERHGRRYCWNSKTCQKFCPKRCRNNCVDENTCCNEACLGGCSPDNVNECISCRNFSIYNSTCTDKCPNNFYKYLDRRCLTAESCNIIGTKYENNRQEVLVAFDGTCSTVCPEGYTKTNKTCQKCGDICTKICDGSVIDSVAKARDFHACTHIVNSPLTINIKRGGRHLMEELTNSFSSIITIKSSLKVQGTYGIFNLKFFKNLQRIEGETLIEKKYALYVLENTDLETIWNPNQTVKILRGSVYFHFNLKLCPSEIKVLLPVLNQTSFDPKEVSEDSNGYKGTCNTSLLNVTIIRLASLFAYVRIDNPMHYDDLRTFIGYQFLHIEDPYSNATKHAFRPCADKWEVSDPTKSTEYVFQNLKPYTKYSFYVKTLTISTELRNAQSEIQHFKTKSDQPQTINKLQAYSNSSHNIIMNWLPPTTANGKLIKYKIRAVYDKRIQKIESRNYCKNPLKEVSKPDIPVPTITEKPVEPKNCNCKKKNPQLYDDEEIEANIHESIELENSLQNFIYVKKDKSKAANVELNDLIGQNNNTKRRNIEGDPSESVILRHIREASDKEKLMDDSTTSTTSSTTPSTVNKSNNDGAVVLFNETRKSADGEYYEVFVDSVNASTTEYVFTELKHFSWYMLGVEACREVDPEDDIAPDCSTEVKTYVRTLKLENVDRVEEFRAMREATNSSKSNIRILWERPKRPNGAVVSYTISYLLQAPDAVEEKKCITQADYIELGYQQYGYALTNLNPGNYSIRIITNTLAGEGQSSKTIYVDISPVTMPLSVIIGITIGAIVGVLLLGICICYLCRRQILSTPSDLKMFPTINPHYVSLQYIPDDWEVSRDRVIQLNPLGQGSFGMVYEGILKGCNNSNEDTPCAIKTVNENATDRERINFLNEAVVMKKFNTYHVVRLLGVCSRGQPALVIMELMRNGDLKSYLRAHRPDERDELGMPLTRRLEVSPQPPNINRIYQMALEIADGMAYLAGKKFVHRDLAARNCMVAADLTVKIGDFGMTRDIYENDYYRKGTKGLLPVRWMSPESLKDGVYSSSSDVFSYGVVLWEMATLASQPYQGLSNDQVLRYVIDGGVMERPENCPDKLYYLMQKCWHHRPTARPEFLEIIRYLVDFAEPHFREVSFYHTEEGQQLLVRRMTERRQLSGDVFADLDMEDVTTPLRLEEGREYKLNMDNNFSVERRGDSSMAIDDDDPHSTYSLTGSPIVISSTPDENVRNNFNMSRIINSHNQTLSSAPSTSAELRKTGTGVSYYPHPHTHPHHRNLYQPNRYLQQQQQQARHHRSDDVDAYVAPDFELKDLMEIKRESDEQGYEMYDPSPNYSEKVTPNAHDDDEDDINEHATAGQNLLSRSKRQKQAKIMPLSSSMPDEVTGQPPSSALHPSTASATSSNASKPGRYPSLRAVADSLGNNVTSKFRSILFNTHKRSGSNASYKSTGSTGGGVGGAVSTSNNNLTRGGRGKSRSGQNLGTIESGGSGSAGSYCANPRTHTPSKGVSSASENPNYKRFDDASADTLVNKPKMPISSAFSMSSNPNYQVLDESLNTTGTSTAASNPATSSSLLNAPDNPNYQLMQAPATAQKSENVSSYVMMNEPKGQKPSAISISSNPNYQMMGPPPPPPPSALAGTTSSAVLPQPKSPVPVSRIEEEAAEAGDKFKKYPSSSSVVSTSSSHETDEQDDDVLPPKGMKSDRIPLSRRSSSDHSQKKKNSTNRSRSQSSSSSGRSNNTPTTTSQRQKQQASGNPPTSSIASSTLLAKENWLKQQPSQSHQSRNPQSPQPPNGLLGRESS